MYKDSISYELADGVTEEHLLKVAGEIIETWMRKQPGFMKWEIHNDGKGLYTDIVYWENEEAAKKAEADMVNIPNAADWYGCYKEGSIVGKNLFFVAAFE